MNSNPLINVKDLVIKYAPELPPGLKNVLFQLNASECIGLLGRTGSGKLTLTMSILRFVDSMMGSTFQRLVPASGVHDSRSRLVSEGVWRDEVKTTIGWFRGSLRAPDPVFIELTYSRNLKQLASWALCSFGLELGGDQVTTWPGPDQTCPLTRRLTLPDSADTPRVCDRPCWSSVQDLDVHNDDEAGKDREETQAGLGSPINVACMLNLLCRPDLWW